MIDNIYAQKFLSTHDITYKNIERDAIFFSVRVSSTAVKF